MNRPEPIAESYTVDTATYECTVCLAVSIGRPNHPPYGICPEAEETTPCTDCGEPVAELARFPGGRCVACHAKTPAGRTVPTAAEIRYLFGGRR